MLPGWAGAKVVVAGRHCRHRFIRPDRPVIIIGLVGQMWGRHKIKDKISKDEQKSVLAPIRCEKGSLSRKAGAAGGRHGVGAVIAVLEVAGARPEADIVELY